VRAAHEAPRELWIDRSALKAIIGTMLLPAVGDRILANEGYAGQLASEPRDEGRPDNLFEPPPGDPGAHGRFDTRAAAHVHGFDPSWVRAGALCAVLGLLAGAFVIGRSSGSGRARMRVLVEGPKQ
jgi:hypothetical protein